MKLLPAVRILDDSAAAKAGHITQIKNTLKRIL